MEIILKLPVCPRQERFKSQLRLQIRIDYAMEVNVYEHNHRLFTYPVLSDEKDDYKESLFNVDFVQAMQKQPNNDI